MRILSSWYKLQTGTTKSLGRIIVQGDNPCKVLRTEPDKSEHLIHISIVKIKEYAFFQHGSDARGSHTSCSNGDIQGTS